MRFIADKNNLANGVNIAIKAVSQRTTMPILECILIEATKSGLTLTGNDMEMGIETYVNAVVEDEGRIAVEAKMFNDIIRKLPNKDVIISSPDNTNITITCGKLKFNIAARDCDEFPTLPSVDGQASVELTHMELKSAIQETIFAAAMSDSNSVMQGVNFNLHDGILNVTALDGHRIAIRNLPVDETDEWSVIIPSKTLNDVNKIISPSVAEKVTISVSKNHVIFDLMGTRLVSRLIDGKYYDIAQVLKPDYKTKVVINKNALLSCMDRASILTKENDKKPIIMEIKDDEIDVSIVSPMGQMNEPIPVEKEGADLIIGFSPRLIIDALRTINEDEVTLYFLNKVSPCQIYDDEKTYIHAILPVNFVR